VKTPRSLLFLSSTKKQTESWVWHGVWKHLGGDQPTKSPNWGSVHDTTGLHLMCVIKR
jgi:hypothetical protein